jgi:hypothetical protein
MLVTRCAGALALLVSLGGGCSLKYACPAFCDEDTPATFELSCPVTDLTSVELSGPCATGDASPSNYVLGYASGVVSVSSSNPGICHVELIFGTGFTYSADVTFTLQVGTPTDPGCPPCSSYTAPTQGPFVVNNPSNTCEPAFPFLDAGAEQ